MEKNISTGRKGKGHPISLETRKKIGDAQRGKPRLNQRGENSGMWKGGTSRVYKTGYYSFEYIMWRRSIFDRDGYICQQCFGEKGQYITAHHIKSFSKFPELRFNLNNGITLCEQCHSMTDNYKGKANKK